MDLTYIKHERISLKNHPEFSELWIQNIIANDTQILGLGDLVVRDRERRQHKAGRLDLLLEDDNACRYEVEIQLGSTDESHIIRTIEYWERERRLRPDYDHYAVIIAEDITSRFLNVISLFNGSIPLIALQMQAVKIDDKIALIFTKVVDALPNVGDEEEVYAPVSRLDWEKNINKESLNGVDKFLPILQEIDGSLKFKYNKFYIGLDKGGQPYNFVSFRPKKKTINVSIKLPKTIDIDEKIEDADFKALEYDKRYGSYRLSLTDSDSTEKVTAIKELFKLAYERRSKL